MRWLSDFFIRLLNWSAPLLGRKRLANINTDEVVGLLDQDRAPVVLVDVRSNAEIEVSRIPGAITRAEFEAKRDQFSNHIVVAYCTIGGRSLLFASRCAETGMDARNYRGSILAWCEAGRPLAAPDGSFTKKLHTYSRLFQVPNGYERAS